MAEHEELKLKAYPYDQFVVDSEVGKVSSEYTDEEIPIRIRFDTIKGVDVDDVSIKDEKIYFYINHIISRLENIIYNINYTYMLGDAATPLESLLIKLIRFFKSYTTELINLDNIYVVDLKPDNMIKMFEELTRMRKDMLIPEEVHLSYSDVIQIATTDILNGGKIGYIDKYIYEIWLIFDNRQQFGNYLNLRDVLHKMVKELNLDENLYMFDSNVKTTVTVYPKESLSMKDKMIRMYYSD